MVLEGENEMIQKLQELLKEKANLKEQILICEIGDDAYYSSVLYKTHQKQLSVLNQKIESLRSDEKFSTEQIF